MVKRRGRTAEFGRTKPDNEALVALTVAVPLPPCADSGLGLDAVQLLVSLGDVRCVARLAEAAALPRGFSHGAARTEVGGGR
jgi:hypothetical protein